MPKEYFFKEGCFISELLNEATSPSLSIARARVEPGITTKLHALGGTEAYYILSGQGQVTVGNDSWRVATGDVVHIPPAMPQQITNSGTADLIFLAICSPRFREEDYQELVPPSK